jgi:hypothetical protein
VRDFKRRLAGLDGNKTNGQEEAGADSSSTPTLFDLDDEPV